MVDAQDPATADSVTPESAPADSTTADLATQESTPTDRDECCDDRDKASTSSDDHCCDEHEDGCDSGSDQCCDEDDHASRCDSDEDECRDDSSRDACCDTRDDCCDSDEDECCDDSGPDANCDDDADNSAKNDADKREAEYQQQIGALGDQVAQARADLYNLRKEYTNYVRRSKQEASEHRERGHREVLETLIPVLDDIYAAREAGDLAEGPFASIALKLENALASHYSFERYGAQGDHFDPNLHEALMAHESDDVEVATIAQVLQPGYQSGDRVVRATKVIVDNPTSSQ